MNKVYIPDYFDFSNIKSNYLEKLFYRSDFKILKNNNGKKYFSINILRKLYKEDKEKFNDITLELTIRGFTFTSSKNASIFPKCYISENPYIIVVNSKRIDISKIDFKFYGLGLLLNKFQISSNLFFNFIPIEGFLTLNPQLNISLFKKELEEAGFVIKKAQSNVRNSSLTRIKRTENKIDIPDILTVIHEKEYLHYIKIKDFMNTNREQEEFFYEKGVKYMYEVSPIVLSDFLNKFGRGELESLFRNIMKKTNGNKIKKFLIVAFSILETQGFAKVPTEVLFSENKYNMVRKFCLKENVCFLTDFTSELYQKYTKMSGIGVGKCYHVLDVIEPFVKNNTSFDSIKEQQKDLNSLYYISLLSNQTEWIDFCSKLEQVYTKEGIEKLVNRFKLDDSIKKKVKFRVETEINYSIKKINKINVQEIKESIQFNGRYSDLIFWEFSAWIKNNKEQKFINPNFSFLKKIMELPLKEIDKIYEKPHEKEHFYLASLYKQTLIELKLIKDITSETDVFLKRDLDDLEKIIFDERLSNKLTLREVGEKAGVTRERIRQKEKIVRKKIKGKFFVHLFAMLRSLFYLNDIDVIISDELNVSPTVRQLLHEENSRIIYSKKYGTYIVNKKESKKIISEWENLLEKIPLVISKNMFFDQVQTNNYLPEKVKLFILCNYKWILEKCNYKISDSYIVANDISLEQRLIQIIVRFNNNEISLSRNHSDIIKFKNYYTKIFPEDSKFVNVENNLLARKIRGILSRSSKVILSAPATFKIYDRSQRPLKLLDSIYQYLATFFEDEYVISYKKLFNLFKDDLEKEHINSYMMYSILKENFSSSFSFGKGNTMNIFASEKYTTEQIIINKVIKNNGKTSKKELAEELGYEMYTIDQVVSSSKKLKSKQGRVFIRESIIGNISEKLKVTLKQIIVKDIQKKGFSFIEEIYYLLKFDNENSKALQQSNIDTSSDLIIVIKELFPNLGGHSKYVYPLEQPIEANEAILYSFSSEKKYTRNEIINEGIRVGYSESTMYMYLNAWLKKGELIMIDEEKCILSKAFVITEQIQKSIDSYLSDLRTGEKYISLRTISGYRYKLPRIRPLTWTPQLIKHVATKIGYNPINLHGVSASVDPLIILPPEYNSLNYRDLLNESLDEYKGSMHSDNIYEYLIEKGLIVRRKNGNKIIPEEVMCEKVLRVNELFYVERVDVKN